MTNYEWLVKHKLKEVYSDTIEKLIWADKIQEAEAIEQAYAIKWLLQERTEVLSPLESEAKNVQFPEN